VVKDKMMQGGIMEYYERQQISVPPYFASIKQTLGNVNGENENPTPVNIINSLQIPSYP
jgi:hypothetical protein